MAEESFQEKTEKATPKRREKAREKGQVARSTDLSAAGMIEANPHDFLTYRNSIAAQDIRLIAEVHSRHFTWLGERPTAEVARMAMRTGAHAVEVSHLDEDTNAQLVRDIKQAMPDLPVILGGYTNHDNAARRLADADGAFVGTCLQSEGWGKHINIDRVRAYVEIVDRL